MQFLSEWWLVFFGGPWWATLLFAAGFAAALMSWFGVFKTPLDPVLPGMSAAVMIAVTDMFFIGTAIALYRTIWGVPDVPVFGFMIPVLAPTLVIAPLVIWLFWTSTPPRLFTPPWLRELIAERKAKILRSKARGKSARARQKPAQGRPQ